MTKRPKKWARTVISAQARFRINLSEPLGGLDVEFLDADGATVRVVRITYREPHMPTLSDVMSDLADTITRHARMIPDPTSYRLVDDATTVKVTVTADNS